MIERIVLLANGTVISSAEARRFLPASTAVSPAPPARAQAAAAATTHPLVRDYRELHSHSAQDLALALALHGGNQSRAAQSLGMTPRQFGYRWRRLSGTGSSA